MGVIADETDLGRSDQELAAGITGSGDEAAFRVLYRRHTPALYAFISRLAPGPSADVDDLVQDSWLRAIRSLPTFRWESSFRSWLLGIGLNRTREVRRRQQTRERHDAAALNGASVALPDGARTVDLERAIAALPEGYRAILLLHDLEGFTHSEIGQALGIAVGTAKSQLHAARKAMRSMLEPTETSI